MKEKLRRLVIKTFHLQKLEFGNKVSFEKNKLIIPNNADKFIQDNNLINEISVDIVDANSDRKVNTIIDIIPISAKVLGKLGKGITHTCTGVYVLVTGTDEKGEQLADFGSSEGDLNDVIKLDRAGTPGANDKLILIDVELTEKGHQDRSGPLALHQTVDKYIDQIREELQELNPQTFTEKHVFYDQAQPEKKKVAIVKQVAGQGAMQDNLVLPDQPSGYMGGESIIDLDHKPVILTPNEYRDGALRAMT